jgi:hypothetical protein
MKKRRVIDQMKVNRYTLVEPEDSKGFVVVRRVGGNVNFRVRANTLKPVGDGSDDYMPASVPKAYKLIIMERKEESGL